MKERETDVLKPGSSIELNIQQDSCSSNSEAVENPKMSLANIKLTLDEIIPSDDSGKVLLDEDDGLKVTLSYTKNKPCKNTAVVVISIINNSKFPVDDVQLDASVKKVWKTR